MESFSFECNACKLNITGYTNFQRHVNTIEHANNVQMRTSNNFTDGEIVLTPAECELPISTINQNSQSSFSSLGLACDLCQKIFTGNEPYQQHLASAGHKKKLGGLTNPNSSMGQLRCNICDKDFSGIVPYEQHIASKVHLKKALSNDMERKIPTAFLTNNQIGERNKGNSHPLGIDMNGDSMANGTLFNEPIVKPITTEVSISASVVASQILICDVCDKTFTGPIPLQQHMNGQIHKKKEQVKEMRRGLFSPSKRVKVDSVSYHDKIDGINNSGLKSSCLENDLIKGPMSGEKSDMTLHHKTRPPMSGSSQVHPFRCEDCDKNFTGCVPYDQHIKSALHLRKMHQKKQMTEETSLDRNFPTTPKCEIPNSERYYCKICDKQCTGNIPFIQHRLSDTHCRKVQLLNFKQQSNLSKPNDHKIDDNQMSTDDNYANELSKKSNFFQSSSELTFNDILKNMNHVTPDTLKIVTFGVGDKIVF